MEFRLPELGEGIADAVVVALSAKPGQALKAGDALLEVETDKSSLPVNLTNDAVLTEWRCKVGDKIRIGSVVAVLSGSGSGTGTATGGASAPQAAAKPTSAPAPAAAPSSAPAAIPGSSAGPFEFRLPSLGEGIDSGIVVAIGAKSGDRVTSGQELITIETDKSAMPIPSPVAGTVTQVAVKVGDKLSVGGLVMVIQASSAVPSVPVSAGVPTTKPSAVAVATAVSVPTGSSASSSTGNGTVHTSGVVPAGPATRRYAREHGVNLAEVPGTARGGRVTVDDVRGHIRNRMSTPAATQPAGGGATVVPPLPDFSKYGPIEKKPLSNIRKKIAENLTLAWHVAPAVTQFDLADITDLEAGRKRIVEGLPKGAAKVTMTVLAVKAVVAALKEFPHFNASFDLARGETVFKQYYHIGIAVDTERGLVVPVIRDADKKSIRDIAADVAGLADRARAGKLTPDEMRGGTFTITNLGGVGGTAFSPIINYPEAAILGLARSSIQPAYRNNTFEPRLMMPLCLTYDHRIIDGADGARFTTRLVQLFSDPIRLLMES